MEVKGYYNGFWSADDPFIKNYRSVKEMVEEQVGNAKKGRYPDFKDKLGNAAWINQGAKGEYLSVVLADKTRLTLFKEVREQSAP